MKNFVLCFFLIFSTVVFSQDKIDSLDFHRVKPNWKEVDKRSISKVTVSYIYLNDSLVSEVKTTEEYQIEVLQSADPIKIKFKSSPDNFAFASEKELDERSVILQRLIQTIEQKISAISYEFLIDSTNGTAYSFSNFDNYENQVPKIISEAITQFKEELNRNEAETEELKESIETYLKQSKDNAMRLILSSLNALLEPYSYTFPLNDKAIKEVTVEEMSMLADVQDPSIPAKLTISAEENDDKIEVKTSLDYDKAAFLKKAKLSNHAFAGVKPEDLSIIEKKKITFNTSTSWVERFSSDILIEVPGAKVVNATLIYFEEF